MISNLPQFDSKKSLTSYVVWAYHINPEKTIIDLRDRSKCHNYLPPQDQLIKMQSVLSVNNQWRAGTKIVAKQLLAPFAGDGDLWALMVLISKGVKK